MRTIWNGTLELGALSIPVGLASAVRSGDEKGKRLHEACQAPVSLRLYCPADEELLVDDDVVRAWEVAPGQYLVPSEDEAAALEPVESTRMPIGCFVAVEAIDPMAAQKRYWLVPSKAIGRRGYVLLARAMRDLEVAAIVRFTAWKSEWIAAVLSRGDALELARLHFAEDLVPLDETLLTELADIETADLDDLARDLVDRHARALRAEDVESLERPRVRRLLEQLLAGEEIVRPTPAEPDAEPAAGADLEGALRASIKKAPRRRKRAAATR